MSDYNFFTFASNKDGSKIFCRLAYKKKTVVKGFYDFDKGKFVITDYVKSNFEKGVRRNTVKKKLEEILLEDYDWEL
jgi:hypothetical protein